jgi:hypothetical protein
MQQVQRSQTKHVGNSRKEYAEKKKVGNEVNAGR